jgi:hypothetical protein
VSLRVLVGPDGTVVRVDVLGGHPLLVQHVEDSIKKWTFEKAPDTNRAFTLDCDFVLRGLWVPAYPFPRPGQSIKVSGPLRIQVEARPLNSGIDEAVSS